MGFEWIIGLVIVGIILATIEFFIPGIGAFAILSLISFCLATLVLIFNSGNIFVSIAGVVLLIILIFGFIAFMRRSQEMYLKTEVRGKPAQSLEHLLHQEANAYTILRPSGTIEIDGKLYDAIAQGGIIAKGERVRIVRVDYRKIFVRSLLELTKEEGM